VHVDSLVPFLFTAEEVITFHMTRVWYSYMCSI
jgi:hypothetical protein